MYALVEFHLAPFCQINKLVFAPSDGSNEKNMGQMELFVSLTALPRGISSITINTTISLKETKSTMNSKVTLSANAQRSTSASWHCTRSNIILNLNKLTFEFDAKLTSVTLLNNSNVTEQWLQSPSNVIDSISMNNHSSTNKTNSNSNSNSRSNSNPNSKPNHSITPSISAMVPMTVQVHSNTASPHSNHSISPQSVQSVYSSIDSEMKAFKEHINRTMQNWADQTNQRFSRMEKEINSMKHAINANSKITDLNLSAEQSMRMKIWLRDTVKLPMYYDVFMQHGVDSLFVVSLLTMEEIKEMNIYKIGHRLQILHHIKALRQQSQRGISRNHKRSLNADSLEDVISGSVSKKQRTN